jgi:hypothetical protein
MIKLSAYLIGRHFYVMTDHKNLIYLSTSTIPKLVRWRLRLSEFNFTIIHIPGVENVVADGLSRIFAINDDNDTITNRPPNIFAMSADILSDFDPKTFLSTIHNSIVGHRSIGKTIQVIKQMELEWPNYQEDIKMFISECLICQKVKYQKVPNTDTDVHFLHGNNPMSSLSLDSIGPLPMDNFGNGHILVIIDNFSKFVMLYPTPSTEAISYVQSLVHHIGIFGSCSTIRTDGGTQFTANICKEFSKMLKFEHLVVVPYHPQSNGIVERRNAEVMKHLRAIILDRRLSTTWSTVLPLVQNILNNSIDSSIGTTPNKIIFGDMLDVKFPFIMDTINSNTLVSDYLKKLESNQKLVIELSKIYLDKQKQSRLKRKSEIINPVTFEIGDYVLITYPSRPPNKLSPLYRGPMIIVDKENDNIFSVTDLVSNKILRLHVDRLRLFNCPDNTTPNELLELASADKDEFIVDFIVQHTGTKKSNYEFLIRWQGYDPADDTWLPYSEVKDLQALDDYSRTHPKLNLA